jgi:hypothetical protein
MMLGAIQGRGRSGKGIRFLAKRKCYGTIFPFIPRVPGSVELFKEPF